MAYYDTLYKQVGIVCFNFSFSSCSAIVSLLQEIGLSNFLHLCQWYVVYIYSRKKVSLIWLCIQVYCAISCLMFVPGFIGCNQQLTLMHPQKILAISKDILWYIIIIKFIHQKKHLRFVQFVLLIHTSFHFINLKVTVCLPSVTYSRLKRCFDFNGMWHWDT